MEVFLFLIPITIVFVGVMLAGLFWAVRNKQYEDLDSAAERILFDPQMPKKLAKKRKSS